MKLTKTCLAASALAVTASAQANYSINCVSGLHLIVTRASTEPPGFGILVSVKDAILARIPNSDAQWTAYPATLNDYGTSEPQGVGNLTQILTAYVDQCPCTQVALLGYSQGAQVTADVLIGPSYPAFPGFGVGSGIAQKYVDAVQSVIMMGDPGNIPGVAVDVGNATVHGLFVRNNTDNWSSKGLVGKVQSYCDSNDTYCDSGTDGARSLGIHIGYVGEYGTQATDFVVNKWTTGAKNRCSNTTTPVTGTNSTSTSPGSNSTCTTRTASGTATTGTGTPSSNTNGTGITTSVPTARPSSSVVGASPNSAVKTGISTAVLLVALAAIF